ncbi:ImmA/IrrE family metallo-endopeptidase [Congzhengia sp.]|uniref:ImmA/IrrE family metallo-endopeptidase n=1 Tax=Congzhengia sp. TaxID=2944168 RepID=UPI003076F4CD
MENIKMLSYRFLLEAQFKELNIPIEQLETVLEKQDIILVAYSAAESIQGAIPADVWPEVLEGMRQNDGISVVCDDFTAILYSDDLSYGKKLHTIYHELGHIKAKHKRSGKVRFAENEEQEREAEAFAYYTVAPPCILHEIGGMSDCVLARLTGLDSKSAAEAYRLLEEDRQGRLLAIEKQLILQYSGYIKSNQAGERQIPQLISMFGLTAIVVVCTLFVFYLNSKSDVPDIITIPITEVTEAEPVVSPKVTVKELEQIVWKAESGDVYHTDPNCYHIPKTAVTMYLDEAIAAGYRKCKDCE